MRRWRAAIYNLLYFRNELVFIRRTSSLSNTVELHVIIANLFMSPFPFDWVGWDSFPLHMLKSYKWKKKLNHDSYLWYTEMLINFGELSSFFNIVESLVNQYLSHTCLINVSVSPLLKTNKKISPISLNLLEDLSAAKLFSIINKSKMWICGEKSPSFASYFFSLDHFPQTFY